MKKIKIAFIGAGLTMEQHLKVINSYKNKGIELSGIYSRTFSKADKLKKKYKIKTTYKSIDELYKKTQANILVAVVSLESIKKIVIKSSKYPWKIFIEKPFGINFNEADFLKKKLKNKVNNFYIGLNRIHFSSIKKMLEILKKDKSKRIINVFDQQSIDQFNDKRFSDVARKNIMYTNSIHIFTIIKLFCRGKFKKIKKIFSINQSGKKYILKKIYFSSGDIVFLHSLWNRPGPWKLDLSNSNYFFSLDPLEHLKFRSNKSKIYTHIPISKDDINFKTGFKKQFEDFLYKFKKKERKFNFDFSFDLMKLIKKYYS